MNGRKKNNLYTNYSGKPIVAAYILVLIFTGIGTQLKAQVAPHFSQYYIYPAWLNPALTGAMNGTYKISSIYRNQWSNVSTPFSTPGLSAEFVTGKNINLGANIMNQTAGNGGYNYLNGYVSIAYTGLTFGKDNTQRIAFGFSGGIINRRFDASKFQFGDQWTAATGYVPSNPGNESLDLSSSFSFDAGAGVVYFDADPVKKANLFLGFSAYHLTQPEDPFIADKSTAKLPVRYTVHGGMRFRLSETVSLTPNLLYMTQGNAEEKMAGAYAQLQANAETSLLLGANYRIKDAIVPFAGLNFKNYVLGLSYDISTSDLGKMVNGTNSFEISLSVLGRKQGKAPEIDFVCPRL